MSWEVIDVLLIRAYDFGRKRTTEECEDRRFLMRNLVPLSNDGQVSVGWGEEGLPSLADIRKCCLPTWLMDGKSDHPAQVHAYHYALLNHAPAKPDGYNWDPDQRLTEFIALSRLIHSSAADFEYCARLIRDDDEPWNIVPAGNMAPAYTTNPRTFLLKEEWMATAKLVERWRELGALKNKANGRIAQSIWWREMTARQKEMNARWMLLITAIEAIVKVWNSPGGWGSVENFVRGMRLLKTETDLSYSDEDAKMAYTIRSSFAHGQSWPIDIIRRYCLRENGRDYEDEDRYLDEATELYNRTEAILDAALRKAIECGAFYSVFQDDELLINRLKSV